eukprot:7233449-Prymnesium_polylepis.1
MASEVEEEVVAVLFRKRQLFRRRNTDGSRPCRARQSVELVTAGTGIDAAVRRAKARCRIPAGRLKFSEDKIHVLLVDEI